MISAVHPTVSQDCQSAHLSVRPIVWLCNRARLLISFTHRLPTTSWCVFILNQGHSGRFKVTGKVVSGLFYCHGGTLEVLILHKYCSPPENLLWFWSRIIQTSSRSTGKKCKVRVWSCFLIWRNNGSSWFLLMTA